MPRPQIEYSADFLLGLVDRANIPREVNGLETSKKFEVEGWHIGVFYDCGELDYIEYFITPEGEKVDFWKWPDILDEDGCPDGESDKERLIWSWP
jgi:hypothetical protein